MSTENRVNKTMYNKSLMQSITSIGKVDPMDIHRGISADADEKRPHGYDTSPNVVRSLLVRRHNEKHGL